jgi:hypothetical protein
MLKPAIWIGVGNAFGSMFLRTIEFLAGPGL